jgi:hypothetical protein
MISKPETIAASLNVSERLLLFCIATDSDWAGTGITNATVRIMQVINLIEREPGATRFTLTEQGHVVLAALGGPLSSLPAEARATYGGEGRVTSTTNPEPSRFDVSGIQQRRRQGTAFYRSNFTIRSKSGAPHLPSWIGKNLYKPYRGPRLSMAH